MTNSMDEEAGSDVTIETGTLRGAVQDGISSWLGIPFALPPAGELRWRAPQPAASWTGVRDAAAYAHDPMQIPVDIDAAPIGTTPSEDCLYVNVWRPRGSTARLPVLVSIYGGGFVNGGSSPRTYTGARLAGDGLVVVSFNYRVGRFGTFNSPPRVATAVYSVTTASSIRSQPSTGCSETSRRSEVTRPMSLSSVKAPAAPPYTC
ncbi:MAG: carboxylesterase family protein [Devosia sp.]